jgi:nucleotide-binding universal stress UspA family protein
MSRGSWTAKLETADALAGLASNRIQSCFPEWKIAAEALWGSPAKTILETVARWRPDLVVAGSHGRTRTARFLMGSVSKTVVEEAPCSVRVARPGISAGTTAPIRLVIGNDGSAAGDAVIDAVTRRSWPQGTEVRVISVVKTLVPSISERNEVDETDRAWFRGIVDDSRNRLLRAGLIATGSVIDGDPPRDLVREAEDWNADAIFVGARGIGKIERLLLGSVSSAIVTQARCSVEVVRRTS